MLSSNCKLVTIDFRLFSPHFLCSDFFGSVNKSLCLKTFVRSKEKKNRNSCSIFWNATHLFVCLKVFTISNIVCYWMLELSAKSVCLLSAPGSRRNTNDSNWYLWALFTKTQHGTTHATGRWFVFFFYLFSSSKRKTTRRNVKQSWVRRRVNAVVLLFRFVSLFVVPFNATWSYLNVNECGEKTKLSRRKEKW